MKALKKTLILGTAFGFVGLIAINSTSSTSANGTGAPSARTGSPGDGMNCSGCHTGSAVNTIPGVISSDIPASGYIPGTTYTITATISATGINKFGFEISPQSATGVKKGTMVITGGTTTQLITSGKYITHKTAGTAGTGTKTWSFNWIAPAAGSGSLTFYGAFVLANGNNANSGDQVRLSTLSVSENTATTGLEELALSADDMNVYPNPARDFVTINVLSAGKADVRIFDLAGREVRTITDYNLSSSQGISVSDLPQGMYVMRISNERGEVLKKIVKQ